MITALFALREPIDGAGFALLRKDEEDTGKALQIFEEFLSRRNSFLGGVCVFVLQGLS